MRASGGNRAPLAFGGLLATALLCAAPASRAGFVGVPREPDPDASPAGALRPARPYAGCETELGRRGVPFTRVDEARGVLAPIRLAGPLHGVTFRTGLPAAQARHHALGDHRSAGARPGPRRLRGPAGRSRRGGGRALLDVPPAVGEVAGAEAGLAPSWGPRHRRRLLREEGRHHTAGRARLPRPHRRAHLRSAAQAPCQRPPSRPSFAPSSATRPTRDCST